MHRQHGLVIMQAPQVERGSELVRPPLPLVSNTHARPRKAVLDSHQMIDELD